MPWWSMEKEIKTAISCLWEVSIIIYFLYCSIVLKGIIESLRG